MVPPCAPSFPRRIVRYSRSRAKPGFTSGASSRTSSGEAAPKSHFVDVVGERTLAVDLDDGEPLAVLRFQPGVARDVDLFQLERLVGCHGDEGLARAFAQVTAGRVVEDDPGYG